MQAQPTARIVRCRYLKAAGQCTAEAVDPTGEILLCMVHLGRAMRLLAEVGLNVGAQ